MFKVIKAANLRLLLEAANNMRITKDNFVTIITPPSYDGEFTLIYFN